MSLFDTPAGHGHYSDEETTPLIHGHYSDEETTPLIHGQGDEDKESITPSRSITPYDHLPPPNVLTAHIKDLSEALNTLVDNHAITDKRIVRAQEQADIRVRSINADADKRFDEITHKYKIQFEQMNNVLEQLAATNLNNSMAQTSTSPIKGKSGTSSNSHSIHHISDDPMAEELSDSENEREQITAIKRNPDKDLKYRRPIPQDLTFRGIHAEDVNLFIQKFKHYISYMSLSDKEACDLLPLLLRDRAVFWYHELDQKDKESWETLQKALIKKYGPESKGFFQQASIYERTQGPHESVECYSTDMQNRFALAGITGEEKAKVYTRGLRVDIRTYVIDKGAKTFETAEQDALRCEMLEKMRQGTQQVNAFQLPIQSADPPTHYTRPNTFNQNPDNKTINELAKSVKTMEKKFTELINTNQYIPRINRQQQSNTPRDSLGRPRCMKCNRIGHYTNSCYTYNMAPRNNTFRYPRPNYYSGNNQEHSTGNNYYRSRFPQTSNRSSPNPLVQNRFNGNTRSNRTINEARQTNQQGSTSMGQGN